MLNEYTSKIVVQLIQSIILPNLLFDSSNSDDQSQREETIKFNQSTLKLHTLERIISNSNLLMISHFNVTKVI